MKNIKSLRPFYMVVTLLLSWYAYTLAGNELFGFALIPDLLMEDAIGTVKLYTVLVLFFNAIYVPLSIIVAFYNDKLTVSGFAWAVMFSAANVGSAAVWTTMDFTPYVSVDLAVIFFCTVSVMNICNSVQFVFKKD